MFKQLITDWLNAQGLDWRESGNGWLLCQCPNPKHADRNPSAFVSTEEGFIKCHSCNHYVPPSTFVQDGNIKDTLLTAKFHKVIQRLEERHQQKLESERSFLLPQRDTEVTEWRGFTKPFLDTVGIFTTETGRFAGRTIIPFYSADDKLVGFTGRLNGDPADKRVPKYMHVKGIEPSNHIMFGKLIKDLELDCSELIITEGVVDALALLNIGVAASPSLGFRAPNDAFVLECITLGVDSVVLAWDNDHVGLDKMLDTKQTSLFNRWGSKVPTTLGVYHKKVKWLYDSDFKDFGEVPQALLEIMMGVNSAPKETT